MSTTTVPTVASIREGINKAGISERKVNRLEKQLAEAKTAHAANLAAIGVNPATQETASGEEEETD